LEGDFWVCKNTEYGRVDLWGSLGGREYREETIDTPRDESDYENGKTTLGWGMIGDSYGEILQ
jgi:hypothetical protein